MRLNRVFIGKYEPIRRPINSVDGSLIRRIQKARQELTARGKDVVPVRDMTQRTCPKALPSLSRHRQSTPQTAISDASIDRVA